MWMIELAIKTTTAANRMGSHSAVIETIIPPGKQRCARNGQAELPPGVSAPIVIIMGWQSTAFSTVERLEVVARIGTNFPQIAVEKDLPNDKDQDSASESSNGKSLQGLDTRCVCVRCRFQLAFRQSEKVSMLRGNQESERDEHISDEVHCETLHRGSISEEIGVSGLSIVGTAK